MLIELKCVVQTLVLLARGRIGLRRDNVGRNVVFADGSSSKIYRETTMRAQATGDPVLIVVRFRLRWLGTNRIAHALFRFESLFNTVLFAAHGGFRTKLWLTDTATGFYRGIYEWDGADAATEYAEVLRVVLLPWVETGSFDYRVIDGVDRESLLEGRSGIRRESDPGQLWSVPVGRGTR